MTIRKEIIIKDGSVQLLTIEECLKEFEKYIHSQCISYQKTLLGKGINGQSYDYDDLFQIASLSLIKAYDKYDYLKGNKFLTYFSLILANDFNVLIRNTNKASKNNINVTSFEASISTDNEGNSIGLIDLIPCKEIDHIDSIIQSETIKDFLDSLSERTRKIYIMSYFENKTQHEIAYEFKVSRSYISRILNSATLKYRKSLIHKDIIDESNFNNTNKEKIVMGRRQPTKRIDPNSMSFENSAINKTKVEKQILTTQNIENTLKECGSLVAPIKVDPETPQISFDEKTTYPVHPVGSSVTLKLDNPLKGLKVKNLTVELNNFEAQINKEGTRLFELNNTSEEGRLLSIEDLEKIKSDMDTVINIMKML